MKDKGAVKIGPFIDGDNLISTTLKEAIYEPFSL